MKDVLSAIEQRYSTRGFTQEKLSDEELQTLLQAALQAPTATNRQEIHLTVVDGGNKILGEIEEEMLAEAGRSAGAQNFYYGAPTVILLSAEEAFRWSAVDAGIAAQTIALAAEGLGLGSLIIGCIKKAMTGEKRRAFSEALGFPEGYVFEVAVAVGHSAMSKAPHACDMASHVNIV